MALNICKINTKLVSFYDIEKLISSKLNDENIIKQYIDSNIFDEISIIEREYELIFLFSIEDFNIDFEILFKSKPLLYLTNMRNIGQTCSISKFEYIEKLWYCYTRDKIFSTEKVFEILNDTNKKKILFNLDLF